MPKPVCSSPQGFTLIEVLVTLTLMMVAVVGASQLLTTIIKNREVNDVRIRLKEVGSHAKETIDRLLVSARVIENGNPVTLCDSVNRSSITLRDPQGSLFTVQCSNGDPGRLFVSGSQTREMVSIADGFALRNCVIMCSKSLTNWVQPYTVQFAFTLEHASSQDAHAYEAQVIIRN